MSKKLVTSALPYANGALHLGHLAGAYLPADIYVRYLRLRGEDVVWVCGSDEHGAAITIRAKKEGITPQDIIEKYHALNKNTFEQFGISFDMYHRTSAEIHHETAREFFTKLYERGDQFIEKTNEQYYDAEYNQFLADRFIKGICPTCGYEEAYGDQCENCGSTLSPEELIEPVSTLSGNKPEKKETTHWYFDLKKHEKWLKEWIENGTLDGEPHHDPKAWKNHVVGQCKSWLDAEEGLLPRAITRDLDWGIKVPLPQADGKVLYVWFDAPIGYISATKAWAEQNGKNWEDYWKGDDAELIHFIGKDNIVFHCIIFPAMLKAYGDFKLPTNVPANQFLNFEGDKFSKSRGWGIEQHEYLEEFKDFPNKEDALRYALTRNMPENRDADFKWDEFVEFHDKELVGNLGNYLNRILVLTHKYFDGKVPASDVDLTEKYADILHLTASLAKRIELFDFKQAVNRLMEISSWGNTYLQDVSPWKIYKENPDSEEIAECMYVSLQVVTLLSALCAPFIPFTSEKIRNLLNLPALQNGDLNDILENLGAGKPLIDAGHSVNKPELLFAQINDRKDDSRKQIIERQKEKLVAILAQKAAEEAAKFKPVKPEISFEDFTKLDIRTGKITAAEPIKKADKLLKLTVDLGGQTRTVVSGIALQFKPEEVVGQQVAVLLNLAPRKMRGVLSEGMILMAENKEGKLSFVQSDEGFGEGLEVR